MEPSSTTLWVQALLGGGLLSALIVGIDKFRMHPLNKKNADIDHTKTTVGIALDTLEAVNVQYKEISAKYNELEERVNTLQEDLDKNVSLVGHFTRYVKKLYEHWEYFKNQEEPPALTDQIRLEIFKEK